MKRGRHSTPPQDSDPKGGSHSPKRPRHGLGSSSPSRTDSPYPTSKYPSVPSSLSQIPQVSPILGPLPDAREDGTEVLGQFPKLDTSPPVHSHMSLNSVNPLESPDPDSPMPDNVTESESSLQLPSDADLSTPPGPEILCIGHSALPLQSFIQLLRTMQVSLIVDVRARPVSDVNPQFNLLNLESNDDLRRAKMEYIWFGLSLGGRRENMEGLRRHREMLIPDLKNYAAYMTTPEFKEGLAEVKSLAIREAAKGKKIVIMCKEPLHSRCHRRMIADRLVADNWIVQHIGLRESDCVKHEMWNLARLALDGELVYDMPRLVN